MRGRREGWRGGEGGMQEERGEDGGVETGSNYINLILQYITTIMCII